MAEAPELLTRGLWTLRHHGVKSLASKVVRTAANRLDPGSSLLVDPSLVADSANLRLAKPQGPVSRSRSLDVGWVCTPPALGSGGHTTMFRMVRALEQAGHRCHIYLYDFHGGDFEAQRRTIRRGWPTVSAEVYRAEELPARPASRGLDACVATSWESAHVLATLGAAPMQRFYFVQDYEPYFYPRGSEYALAEDSYHFGFETLALGGMVERCLAQLGLQSTAVEFGCDTETYFLEPPQGPRTGVVCYARPENPRRGWLMAKLALGQFHERHPEVPITIYGAAVHDLGFPATVIPRLSPAELNSLYNSVVAGLALSFTNVSLVPEEMLCAGAIPVVNDAPDPRACLDNPFVSWADPTPSSLAAALSAAVEHPAIAMRAESAAASVDKSWVNTGAQVVEAIEHLCYESNERTVATVAGRG